MSRGDHGSAIFLISKLLRPVSVFHQKTARFDGGSKFESVSPNGPVSHVSEVDRDFAFDIGVSNSKQVTERALRFLGQDFRLQSQDHSRNC